MRLSRLFISGFLWAGILFAPHARGVEGNPHLIMSTLAGDILLELYPQFAPRHVRQILRLARNGVYHGVHFYRVEPGFVIQLAEATDRLLPLSEVQSSLITDIPGEFTPALRHGRGLLSMARWEDRPDSARTSFSVLLGPAPHLDGKYTIFGRVVRGMEVVEELARVPVDAKGQPSLRLTVFRTDVLGPGQSPSEVALAGPFPVGTQARALASQQILGSRDGRGGFLVYSLMFLAVTSLLGFLLSRRLPAAKARSLLLLNVGIAGFCLFCHYTPGAGASPLIGMAILLSVLAFFRLMSHFEAP